MYIDHSAPGQLLLDAEEIYTSVCGFFLPTPGSNVTVNSLSQKKQSNSNDFDCKPSSLDLQHEAIPVTFDWQISSVVPNEIQSHIKTIIALAISRHSLIIDDDVSGPSTDCKYYSESVLSRLFLNYGVLPVRFMVSRDGSLFFSYSDRITGSELRIEVDNELDAVAVLSRGKEVIDSAILENDDGEIELIKKFQTI